MNIVLVISVICVAHSQISLPPLVQILLERLINLRDRVTLLPLCNPCLSELPLNSIAKRTL
jgi:hypothetical protein